MEATDNTEVAAPARLTTPTSRYYKVKDVAAYFGVGLSTIYQAIEAGDLPAIAIGRGSKKALRVHHDAFRAFEEQCRVHPTVAELAA